MSVLSDIVDRLDAGGSLAEAATMLEEELSKARDLEGMQDVLGACSLVLQLGALRGELILPPLGRALDAVEKLRGPEADTAVIGLGGTGRAALASLTRHRGPGLFPRAYYIDVETSRIQDLDGSVVPVILGDPDDGDSSSSLRLADQLRAVYRSAAGSNRPPALLAEGLSSSPATRLTLHVVAGLEDPWLAVLLDLLLDLRSFVERQTRCRVIVHLLTRPSPRLLPYQIEALQGLEKSKPFDDCFIVCAHEDVLAARVVEFILLSFRAPELLLHHGAGRREGVLGSYGVAEVATGADGESAGRMTMEQFERAYRAASPAWIPGASMLDELAVEHVACVHRPGSPPPEAVWRLCHDLAPLALEVAVPLVCRIQRGGKLSDLRLA